MRLWTAENLGYYDGWFLQTRDEATNVTAYPDKDSYEFVEKADYDRLKSVCDWLQGYVEGAIDTHYWSMNKGYLAKEEIQKFRDQIAKLKGET